MFFTLVVILCHTIQPTIAMAPYEVCKPAVVTDSDQDASLNFMSCQVRVPALSAWKQEHFEYDVWHITKWKCVQGKYVAPNNI